MKEVLSLSTIFVLFELHGAASSSGYFLITNSGKCVTAESNWPGVCQIDKVALIADCEAYCTNQQSCVGYSYQPPRQVSSFSMPGFCELYPTESTCPTSLTSPEHVLHQELLNLAGSVDDLIPSTVDPFYECYGKTPEEVPQDVCKNHNGIPHKSKPVCCHNKCPECGGKNWKKFCKGKGTDKSGKKLGNKKCCGWRIEQEGKICGRNGSKAPCILEQY